MKASFLSLNTQTKAPKYTYTQTLQPNREWEVILGCCIISTYISSFQMIARQAKNIRMLKFYTLSGNIKQPTYSI